MLSRQVQPTLSPWLAAVAVAALLVAGTPGQAEERNANFRVEAPSSYGVFTGVTAGRGTVSCTPNPVVHGHSVICTATPAMGFNFSSWDGMCRGADGSRCTLSNVTAAQSVTARFTPVPLLRHSPQAARMRST